MLRAMSARRGKFVRWLSLPLLAIPGPCTTFDGETAAVAVADGGPDGGDAGAPDVAPIGPQPYLSTEDAARACSLVSRCPTLAISIGLSVGIPVAADQFASCVHFLASPIPPSRPGFDLQRGVLRKIAEAADCKQALEAAPTELLYGADPRCPDGGGYTSCYDDTHTVFCQGTMFGAFSTCAGTRGGEKCVTVDVPDAGPVGICAKGACDAFVPDAFCEKGTILHTCDPRGSRVETVFDCGWVGLTCANGPEGYPTCLSPSETTSCTQYGQTRCEGGRLLFCMGDQSAQWSAFDCGAVGAECVAGSASGTRLPLCLHRDAECSPLEVGTGTCTGSTISLCVDGRKTTFDCGSIAKRCDPQARACL